MCLTSRGLLRSESVILVRRPLQRSRLQTVYIVCQVKLKLLYYGAAIFLVLRQLRDAAFNLSVLAADMWRKGEKLMLFPDFNF